MANDSPEQATAELTEREQEILRLLATGTSNKEIARQLFISANTVKVHLRNIFSKIGVTSRTEAAMYALRMGIASSSALTGNSPESSQPLSQSEGPATTENTASRELFRWISFFMVLIVLLGISTATGFLVKRPAETPASNNFLSPTATVESRWDVRASLPAGRDSFAIVAFDNLVYAIGGETDTGVTGAVDGYDPATDSWKALSPKPLPVADVNAAVLGGKIYVPGGRTSSGEITDKMEFYDPRLNKWEEGTPLPMPLSAYALATFEGRLYLFGGWDGKNYLNNVFIYKPDLEQWSAGIPMPTARGFAGTTVVEGKAYVVGGRNETGPLTATEMIELGPTGTTSGWQAGLPLPQAFSSVSLVNVVDLVYAVASEQDTNGIYVYLIGTAANPASWEFLPMPYAFGPGFGTVLLGQTLYIMGGSLEEKPLSLNASYKAIYTILLPVTK